MYAKLNNSLLDNVRINNLESFNPFLFYYFLDKLNFVVAGLQNQITKSDDLQCESIASIPTSNTPVRKWTGAEACFTYIVKMT